MESSTQRSNSKPRAPSRPTTPLRPSSRSSIRDYPSRSGPAGDRSLQPAINTLEPQFAEFSDSMADLEANFMHLQLLHESLSRFSENFASFLYGLNMNAFCVDFPEAPIADSFRRAKEAADSAAASAPEPPRSEVETEATFLTTDTSFIDNPPASSRNASKFSAPSASGAASAANSSRGTTRGRYSTRGSTGRQRTSGLVRPRARGTR